MGVSGRITQFANTQPSTGVTRNVQSQVQPRQVLQSKEVTATLNLTTQCRLNGECLSQPRSDVTLFLYQKLKIQ